MKHVVFLHFKNVSFLYLCGVLVLLNSCSSINAKLENKDIQKKEKWNVVSKYSNGKIQLKCTDRDNNKMICKEYHETGKLKETIIISDVKNTTGIRKIHFQIAGLPIPWTIEKDIINGEESDLGRVYDKESGKLLEEINWVDGKPNGVQKSFNKNGELVKEIDMKDGIPDGISRYYENGMLVKEEVYTKGALNGHCKAYDKNGVLQNEAIYRAGKIDSFFKTYNDGMLKQFESYSNGNILSLTTFTNDGFVDKEWKYENGKALLIKDNLPGYRVASYINNLTPEQIEALRKELSRVVSVPRRTFNNGLIDIQNQYQIRQLNDRVEELNTRNTFLEFNLMD